MTMSEVSSEPPELSAPQATEPQPVFALVAAILGFFVVTLDAVVVNVALPSIRADLGGGVTGLQWVVDGYTLLFAAFLLSSGSMADRIGAKRAFGLGIALFVAASVSCGLAPGMEVLLLSRLAQGASAALIMPASLTLISQAYPDRTKRARAVGLWALGGAVASTSGPILGGALTQLDWRLIFWINVPAGGLALLSLSRTRRSPRRKVAIDWLGQATAVTAMGSLTFAAIEAGPAGLTAARVLAAAGLSCLSTLAFVIVQSRVAHPMVPLDMFGSRTFRISLATGFAFMVGYYGLPFIASLYLQQERGLGALGTGLTFLPMMLIGLTLTPISARIVERLGARTPVSLGLASMTLGLLSLAVLPSSAPLWAFSALMVLVGLGGPLTMPPVTAVLLNHVPGERTGIASGVFNTSRQVGGALSVAVFGTLLADPTHFVTGMRASLVIAGAVLLAATLASLRLPRH